jgi:hypothetical protein
MGQEIGYEKDDLLRNREDGLLVVADAATQVANFRNEAYLRNWHLGAGSGKHVSANFSDLTLL